MNLVIDTFHVSLTGWNDRLQEPDLVSVIETQLHAALPDIQRLLRWAVVKALPEAPDSPYWCEGAYLRHHVQRSA